MNVGREYIPTTSDRVEKESQSTATGRIRGLLNAIRRAIEITPPSDADLRAAFYAGILGDTPGPSDPGYHAVNFRYIDSDEANVEALGIDTRVPHEERVPREERLKQMEHDRKDLADLVERRHKENKSLLPDDFAEGWTIEKARAEVAAHLSRK
ncbi:hypothetical protein ACWDXV_16500 [Nocardia nova]